LLDTVRTRPVASVAASIPTKAAAPAAEAASSVRVPVTPVSAPEVAPPAPRGVPSEPRQPGQPGHSEQSRQPEQPAQIGQAQIGQPPIGQAQVGLTQTGQTGQPQQPKQQIVATLHQYERAYEQLDAKAVRAVWPSVDARALERAFHDLKSQTLVFDRCDVDVARVQAKAACRGRATYETRAGQLSSRTEPREWTFTLQKHDDAWRIVSASAR